MAILESFHYCPVCGFDIYGYLHILPWKDNSPSYEICPSCGIQYGYSDWAKNDIVLRQKIYVEWREKWVNSGMRWHDNEEKKPIGWNPKEQLKNIEIILNKKNEKQY